MVGCDTGKPVERFEVGKWYQPIDYPDRDPGRCIKVNSSGSITLEHVTWVGGHDAGGIGAPKRCYYYSTPLREVPAPTDSKPRRLTVGDRVIIVGGHPAQKSLNGHHGVIEKDDCSPVRPYFIRADSGEKGWRTEEDVIPEPSDKMSGEAQIAVIGLRPSASFSAELSKYSYMSQSSKLPETEIDDRLADRIFSGG